MGQTFSLYFASGLLRVLGAANQIYTWRTETNDLKVCFLNGDADEKERVKSLVEKHYNSIPMGLRLVFLSQGDPNSCEIRIYFGHHSGSCDGKMATCYPDQPTIWLNMHPHVASQDEMLQEVQAVVLREFGHALGLEREHKHPDFEAKWNFISLMERTGLDLQTLRLNYDKNTTMFGPWFKRTWDKPYDPKSIMHYEVQKGDTEDRRMVVPKNIVLSDGNRDKLISLYPPPVVVVEQPPKPPLREILVSISENEYAVVSGGNVEVSENASAMINGDGYVVVTDNAFAVIRGTSTVQVIGNASATVHSGGDILVTGNAQAIVYGDSTVEVSDSGEVWVDGSGSAVVSGNGSASFTGKATGTVSGNGSIHSYV